MKHCLFILRVQAHLLSGKEDMEDNIHINAISVKEIMEDVQKISTVPDEEEFKNVLLWNFPARCWQSRACSWTGCKPWCLRHPPILDVAE